MRIFQNREILSVNGNENLSNRTKALIEELLRLAERDEVRSCHIDAVVASTPGWEYKSAVDDYVMAAEIPNHPSAAACFRGRAYQQEAQRVLASLREGCKLDGVYFGDDGFLGFAFTEKTRTDERRAFALQLPWTNRKKGESYRHMLLWKWTKEGNWFRKAYQDPALGHFGYGPVSGPLGIEFTQYIDSHGGR